MSLQEKCFRLEPLEQRVLLSADSLSGMGVSQEVDVLDQSQSAIMEEFEAAESSASSEEVESAGLFDVDTQPLEEPVSADTHTESSPAEVVATTIDPGLPEPDSALLSTQSDGANDPTEYMVTTLHAAQGPPMAEVLISAPGGGGTAMGANLEGEPSVDRPMLIVPGIAGTFAAPGAEETWYTQRGIAPEFLEIDPLAGFYDDILATFENAAGYVLGDTLFAAAYDWRMATGPAPNPGEYDGVVDGLTAQTLTDDIYEFSVDYLGYWMELAVTRWTELYGTAPDGVDLVTHSTGGLVARTYIQSDAYGQSNGTIDLPVVQNLVMVGVPNRGAPKAWNPLFNDFSADVAFQIVLSKAILKAYDLYLAGEVIQGADGNISLTDTPGLTPEQFIVAYVPTIQGLLATYDFLYPEGEQTTIDANGTEFINEWILDLNDGLDFDYSIDEYEAGSVAGRDPNQFALAGKVAGTTLIVYSDGSFTLPATYSGDAPDALETIVEVRSFTGVQDPGDVVANFDEFYGHNPEPGESWYRVLPAANSGDGTVPTASSFDQFDKDPLDISGSRYTFLRVSEPLKDADDAIIADSIGHTGLMGNLQMQTELLNFLGVAYDPTKISTTEANEWYETLAKVIGLQILDPAELLDQADWTEISEFAINQGIRQGLNVASEWFAGIDQQVVQELGNEGLVSDELNPLQWPVPFTHQSLGQLLSFRNFFNTYIAFPIIEYMEDSPGGGTAGLVDWIKGLNQYIPDSISDGAEYTFNVATDLVRGGVIVLQDPRIQALLQLDLTEQQAINEAIFSIPFAYSRTSQAPMNLGPLASMQGLQLDPVNTIEYTAAMEGTIVFGYDMREGLADDQRFFIRFNDLKVSAQANASNISAALNVGALGTLVTNGSVTAEAGLRFGFDGSAKDEHGNITQRQLADNTGVWDGFLNLNPASGPYASLDANLPITVDYPGLEDVIAPVLTMTGDDLFNKLPEISTSGFGNLSDFASVSLNDLESMLTGMLPALQDLVQIPDLQQSIPFAADLSLGSLLNLSGILETSLLDSLRTSDGKLAYGNLQEFLSLVDSTMNPAANGSLFLTMSQPMEIHTSGGVYDASNHQLGLSFSFSYEIASYDHPFSFAYDLSPLEIQISGGSFTVTGDGTFSFDLLLDMAKPMASVKADEALAVNGILNEPVQMQILLNGGLISYGQFVVVEVLPDATNASALDLVADVNAALALSNLAGLVEARLEAGYLVLETRFQGPNPLLLIANAEGLGFVSATGNGPTAVTKVNLSNLSAGLSLNLTASQFSASAKIGYAGIFIEEGSADLTLGFELDLLPGGPVPLVDFGNELSTNPEAYNPVITLSASGGLLLQGITTEGGLVEDPVEARSIEIRFAESVTFPLSPTDPSQFVVTFNGDFTDLLKFEALDFETMIQLLRDGLGILGDIVQYDFLDAEIPFLGGSVNDLLDIILAFTQFIADLERNNPATIQDFMFALEIALQNLLDLTLPGQDLQADAFINLGADDMLRIDFSFLAAAMVSKRFEFDPGGAIPGLDRIIDLNANSMLEASLAAWIQFSMGIDLSTPSSPVAYLLDGTEAIFEIFLSAEGLSFRAAAPLAICINGGYVYIDDGTPDKIPARASFVFSPSGTNRLPIGSVGLGDFSTSIIGEIRAGLPLCPPIGDEITFEVNFLDFANPTIHAPDFESIFSGLDLFDSLGNGLDLLFLALEEVADGDIFGFSIPFIGDQLGDVASFILDLRLAIGGGLEGLAEYTEVSIANKLFELIGIDGLQFLLPIMGSGLPNPGEVGELEDIRVDINVDGELINGIEIEMRLGQIINLLSEGYDFDDGLPGLDLNFDVGLDGDLKWEWRLVFGVSRTGGFYIKGFAGDELTMNLDVRLPGTNIGGSFGFMTALAIERDGGPLTGMNLDIGIDLNPSGGVITLADLTSAGTFSDFNVSLSGQADMDLMLVLSIADLSGDPIDALPSFEVDFKMDWSFDQTSLGFGLAGSLPNIEFTDIRLNVGSFFDDFLRPIILTISAYLDPIRPVLDFLYTDIFFLNWGPFDNMLDQDRDGNVTLIDFAAMFGYFDPSSIAFLNALKEIDFILGKLPNLPTRDGNLTISLGSFDFGEFDLRVEGVEVDPQFGFSDPTNSWDFQMGNLGGDAGTVFAKTQIDYGLGTGKFNFHLFEAENLIRLILGESVTFFTYEMPDFSFNFLRSLPFPLGPLTLSLEFSAGFRTQFAFGYDSSGINGYLASGGEPKDIFGGFYIEVGKYRPQLSLYGGVSGSASLDLLAVEATARVGLELRVNFNLVDPGNGKLYIWQIANLIEQKEGLGKALNCLYYIDGKIVGYAEFVIDWAGPGYWSYRPGEIEFVTFSTEGESCFSSILPDRLETPKEGFQSNDTIGFAADIGIAPGIHLRGASISNPGDVDFYKIETLKRDSLWITLVGKREFEISILNKDGLVVGSAAAGSETKEIKTRPLIAGVYYIRIAATVNTPEESAAYGVYTLDIEPGSTSQTRVFYISNPQTTIGDYSNNFYTLADGSDSLPGAGWSPLTPAASLAKILTYNLTATDLVLFDTGLYDYGFSVSAGDPGFLVAGAPSTPYREFPEYFLFGSQLWGSVSGSMVTVSNVDNFTLAKFVFGRNETGLTVTGSDYFRGIDLTFNYNGTGAHIEDSDYVQMNRISASSYGPGSGVGIEIIDSTDFRLDMADFESIKLGIRGVNVQDLRIENVESVYTGNLLDMEGIGNLTMSRVFIQGGEVKDRVGGGTYLSGYGITALNVRDVDIVVLDDVIINRYGTGLQISNSSNIEVNNLEISDTEIGLSGWGLTTMDVISSDLLGTVYGVYIGDSVNSVASSDISFRNYTTIGNAPTTTINTPTQYSESIFLDVIGLESINSTIYGRTSITNASNVVWLQNQIIEGSLQFKQVDDLTVTDNTVLGQLASSDSLIALEDVSTGTLTGNTMTGPGNGIKIVNSQNIEVSTNVVSGAGTAIHISGIGGYQSVNVNVAKNILSLGKDGILIEDRGTDGIPFGNSETAGITIIDNQVLDFTRTGIRALGYAVLEWNFIKNCLEGIRFESDKSGMWNNTARDCFFGYTGGGFIGNEDYLEQKYNVAFNNEYGIFVIGEAVQTVAFNKVFNNNIGILASGMASVHHNLAYNNNTVDANLSLADGASFYNNTIYSTGDYGLQVSFGSRNVDIRNNIVWSVGGTAMMVGPGSGDNLTSDYNDYFVTGGGTLFEWNKPINDLFDWQVETGQDLHSIGTTLLDTTTDQPRFVNLLNGDFHIVDLISPTINAGDPSFDFANEPGPGGGPNGTRINLGAYGNTAQAALSASVILTVVSPDYYLDFTVDQARRIAWKSYNGSGNVTIELHQVGVGKLTDIATVDIHNLPAQLAEQPADEGSYFWSPQMSGIAGNDLNRYFIRVVSVADSSVHDRSREAFSITEPSDNYYVNDGSQAGDTEITAIGNNRNTGKTAATPKAIIFGILENYALASGDTVFIETGEYLHVRDLLITLADEAFVLTGPAGDAKAVFDRSEPRNGTTGIILDNASYMTIRNLTITGSGTGIEARNNSTFLTLDNLELKENYGTQVYIHSGSDRATLNHLYVHHGQSDGVVVEAILESLLDSSILNNGGWGVHLTNTGNAEVESSTIVGNDSGGIYIKNTVAGTVTTIGHEDLTQGRGNVIYDNAGRQVDTTSNAVVVGNSIFITPGNSLEGTGTGIYMVEGTARSNVIAGQATGIYSKRGVSWSSNVTGSAIETNRIYNTAVRGIWLDAIRPDTVTGNVIYSTPIGIESQQSPYDQSTAPVFHNNLIYDTSTAAISLNYVDDFSFENNTIYALSGTGMLLRNSVNGDIRNNIFHVESRAAIDLDTGSQTGLQSDFNLFYVVDFGFVGKWAGGERYTLAAWRSASFLDKNSLEINPRFVDPAGADGTVGYNSFVLDGRDDNFHLQSTNGSVRNGSLAPVLSFGTGKAELLVSTRANDLRQSPAIDRGDDLSAFNNEPGPNGNFINMGAFGNTAQASFSPDEYVLVTAPSGGETWPIGQRFDIRWRSHDFAGTVDIVLRKDGTIGTIAPIATATANDGSFSWLVPDTLSPANSYVVEVTRTGLGGASGQSEEPFTISDPISFYFVNDGVVDIETFTRAEGDDANDGLSPDTPKASIRAILEAYDLGEGDVILVDAGDYAVTTSILIGAEDSGVTIRGFSDPARPELVARLDRASIVLSTYIFELVGTSNLTFENLRLENAWEGIHAGAGGAVDLTVRDCVFYHIQDAGIFVGADNPGMLVEGSKFTGSNGAYRTGQMYYGISFRGTEATIRGNSFLNNSGSAIYTQGVATTIESLILIEGNTVTTSSTGIEARSVSTLNKILVRDNILTGSTGGRGFYGYGLGLVVTGNFVFSNKVGIHVFSDGLVIDNLEVHDNVTGIYLTGSAIAKGNSVYDNDEGIFSEGSNSGKPGLIEDNVVHGNVSGIRFKSYTNVIGNLVYANERGLHGDTYGGGTISNNVVYGNTEYALRVYNLYSNTAQINNNTLVQSGANATAVILVKATNFSFKNNIVSVDGGQALDISADSQAGFAADYNLFHLTNGANAFLWGSLPLEIQADWYYNVGADAHSLFTDPLFVDPLNGDYHLRLDSPGIDAGDPGSSYAQELEPSGNRINVGAYGNTKEAALSVSKSVQVISPTGLDKALQGSETTISFHTSGFLNEQVAATFNAGPSSIGNWQSIGNISGGTANNYTTSINMGGVVNPAPEAVYQSIYRSDSGLGKRIDISLDLTPGQYVLRLHFVGVTASYTFDIEVNGALVREDYSIVAAAGGTYKAVIEEVPVTVGVDGKVEIALINTYNSPSSGNSEISAVEAIQVNPLGTSNPKFGLEVSFDSGATFSNVAKGITVDRNGMGYYDWTPFASTKGKKAMVQVISESDASVNAFSEAFLIANDGNRYYVNDTLTIHDVFTSADGDNENTGKDEDSPMASLEALLTVYSPVAGDTIFVDSGTYSLTRNIVLNAEQSGVTIVGAYSSLDPDAVTVLDRANRTSPSYGFELNGTTNITLERLTISNAYRGVYAGPAGAVNLTVRDCTFLDNENAGIYLEANNPGLLVEGSFIEGSGSTTIGQGRQVYGIYYESNQATIRNNSILKSENSAIYLYPGYQAGATRSYLIEGNTITGNRYGIYTDSSVDFLTVRQNIISESIDTGVLTGGANSLVTGNTIFGCATGIRSTGALVADNLYVYNNSIGIDLGAATAIGNGVYGNSVGIKSSISHVLGNSVYENDTGIESDLFSEIIGNRAYDNQRGLYVQYSNGTTGIVSNNIFYGNTEYALRAYATWTYQGSLQLSNNTVVHSGASSTAIILETAPNVKFFNNILAVDGGLGVNVDAASQGGFSADYNLYWLTNGATAIQWDTLSIDNQTELFYSVGAGAHSIFADPRFVGAITGNFHLRSDSPAIDAGNPVVVQVQEMSPSINRPNIGAYGNTSSAALGEMPLIQVVDPVSLDKLIQNQDETIRFVASGFLAEQTVVNYNIGDERIEDWLLPDHISGGTLTEVSGSTTVVDLSGVANPAPDSVYYTSLRTASGVGERMDLSLNLQPGEYVLKLHFVEYSTLLTYTFNIEVNGVVVRQNYSIRNEAGNRNKAVVEEVPVTVGPDGVATLSLVATNGIASIAGLEVLRVNPSGLASPRFTVEASYDGGTNYIAVARGVGLDSHGIGVVSWTPLASTEGADALIRVTSENKPSYSGTSDLFPVSNDSNVYYINDDSTGNDVYTKNTGDDLRNTGKTPDSPMASLSALLSVYNLSAGDVVKVDTGTYQLTRNILLTAAQSGIIIRGAYNPEEPDPENPASITVLHRGNTSGNAFVFEINGATDITLENLFITGAYTGIYLVKDSGTDNLVFNNLDIFENTKYGIMVESGNGFLAVEDSRFRGTGVSGQPDTQEIGINTSSPNMAVRNSVFTDNFTHGIWIGSGSQAPVEYILIEDSVFEGGNTGLRSSVDNTTVKGSVFGNISGIAVFLTSANSVVQDSVVHHSGFQDYSGPQPGIYVATGATAINNIVYENIMGIHGQLGTSVLENTVWGNGTGIKLAGARAEGNRVFGNTTFGITASDNSQIIGNKVYGNEVGIQGTGTSAYYGFYGKIESNIVFNNGSVGIQIDYGQTNVAKGLTIINNTVYQPAGEALRLRNVAVARIQNNILQVDAGVAINSDSKSYGTNVAMDYNLIFLSDDPNARTAEVNGAFVDTLAAWTAMTGKDAHSLIGDPMFFDINGADDVWGYGDIDGLFVDGGFDDNFHLLKFSEAIDRGDASLAPDFDAEGDIRRDDPGTTNAGADEYQFTILENSLFDAGRGTAKGWTSSGGNYVLALPFEFTFYGQTYSQVGITTAGMIGFPSVNSNDLSPTLFDFSSRIMLAAYWANVDTLTGSGRNIFVDTSVVGEVYIRFEARNRIDSSPVRYAVLLKDDGTIRFDYGTGNKGLSPTVGLSAGDRMRYLLVEGYNSSADLSNAPSVEFVYGPGIHDIGAYEFKGDSLDNNAPAPVATFPLEVENGGSLTGFLDEIQIQMSESIDTIDAISPEAFELIRDANDDGFFTMADEFFAMTPFHDVETNTIQLSINYGVLPDGIYQFRIISTNFRDVSGNQLDGDGTGTGGTDYLSVFTVNQPVLSELTSESSAVAVRGEQFSFQLSATADPTSFTIEGLPTGLTLNSDTGLISGIPSEAGVFNLTLSITNAEWTNEVAFSISILAAPQITEVIINDGAAQRSTVTQIKVLFDSNVGLSIPGATIQLIDQNTLLPVDPNVILTAWSFVTQTITMTFPGLPGASLEDGRYLLTIDSATVNANGLLLDGDSDGSPGGDFSFSLHRFLGDSTGSMAVDILDGFNFRRSYGSDINDGTYKKDFDFNNDGLINTSDKAAFEGNFLTTLPGASIAAAYSYSLFSLFSNPFDWLDSDQESSDSKILPKLNLITMGTEGSSDSDQPITLLADEISKDSDRYLLE